MKKLKIIRDEKTNTIVFGKFDKVFKNDKYELSFNSKTGLEVLKGINGNEDPFMTDLPTMLDCGIMGHCKNNCEFCYQGDKYQENMKLEDFKQIIDELKYHTNQVALGGRGNPEDHKDFKEILKYSRENGIVPNYTTAGNYITPEIVQISKEYSGAVAISFYNRPFTYKALDMFIEGEVKTNIHLIYSSKSHDLAMRILKGEDVWDNKINLKKLNAIIFLLFKPKGKGANLPEWFPLKNQIEEFGHLIGKAKTKFKIGVDSCLINHILKFADFNEQQRMSVDTCESGRMSVYITPDMKLVPCSFADHDLYGCDIKNHKIKDVWEKAKPFQKFREILKENSKSCPALY